MRLTNDRGRARHEIEQRLSDNMDLTISRRFRANPPPSVRLFTKTSRPHAPRDGEPLKHAARDLLDGRVRGFEIRDAIAVEQLLGGAHLECALLRGRITAVGPAFLPDLLQSDWLDREAEQL